jgi:hypothetical protein
MSSSQPVGAVAKQVPASNAAETTGLTDAASPLDELTERRVDEIEMIGEETAAGLPIASGHSEVTAGMRYLHCSRTIHQLVTDRNRAVGIYLAVASLLLTACGALLNAKPTARLLVPIEIIQRWCLPVAFGTLSVLAVFTAFLLIRTRIGLIYEVAKMNVLLGLPIGRVQRIGVLSIFFIMQVLISLAGGGAATLFTFHLAYAGEGSEGAAMRFGGFAGATLALFLVFLYIGTVLYTTAEGKLKTPKS